MPRKLRVATTSWARRDIPVPRGNLEFAWTLLEAAGASGADIVVLPETFNVARTPLKDWPGLAERSIPGPVSYRLAEYARKFEMYVVAGLLNYRDGLLRNTSMVLDHQGNEVGRYEKYHPTMEEISVGVVPGDLPPRVFPTGLGRIGLETCFDIAWPEDWDALGHQGAELVFWPSAYDGGSPLEGYAARNRYYLVSSVYSDHSKVIDITGEIIGGTSPYSSLFVTEIDLEKETFLSTDNELRILEMQTKYGRAVTVRSLTEETLLTIESNDPEITVEQLKREFGLENYADYHARARAVQDERRSAKAKVPT